MENDITNVILEERIKNSLFVKAPEGFTDKLLEEIRLSEDFAKEDRKTGKALKYFTLVSASIIIAIGTYFLYFISGRYEDFKGNEDNFLKSIPGFFSAVFIEFLELLGLTVSNLGIIYLFIILIILFIFTLSDKYIFKKIT